MNYFKKKKERNQIGNVTTHFKFKRKRKRLYYYLPTSIECTPIFYSRKKNKRKLLHRTAHTWDRKADLLTGTQWAARATGWTFRRKGKPLWTAGNKVINNWTRSFWLRCSGTFFFPLSSSCLLFLLLLWVEKSRTFMLYNNPPSCYSTGGASGC